MTFSDTIAAYACIVVGLVLLAVVAWAAFWRK